MMLKKKKENRSSEIIEWFYNQRFDKDTEDRIKEKFSHWYANKDEGDKKEILEELLRREFFGSDDELEIPPEKLVQYELLLRKYDAIDDAPRIKQINPARRLPLRRVLLRVAAVVIPLLAVGGIWWITSNNQPHVQEYAQQYVVPNGKTEELNLPDSTTIKVNAGTNLNIKQDDAQRIAELSGESYFKVAKDPERPFKVVTSDLTVTVLGTEFNVEAYPASNATIVTLLEGSIKLTTSKGENVILQPNQSYVYDKVSGKGRLLTLTKAEADDNVSWTKGNAAYNFRTLNDLFEIIERRFAVEIVVDPGVDTVGQEYIMRIDVNETPEVVMSALSSLTERFDYRIEDKKIYVLVPKRKQ